MNLKTKIGENNLEIQTENLAEQASGYCLIKMGETSILATCQNGEKRAGLGFFPLTCEYQERFYAAGKILGSRFIRREGRPSNEAILISRMIDRAIRPLFPKELMDDMQIIATCLSWDEENDPAVLALLGASFALMISDIPWLGPVGAVRIGKIKDDFILNPTYKQREESEMDLVFSAIEKDGKILINMMECQGEEIQEEAIVKAYDFAEPFLKEIIKFQKEAAKKIGKEKVSLPEAFKNDKLEKEIKNLLEKKMKNALYQKDKKRRNNDLEDLKNEMLEKIKSDSIENKEEAVEFAKNLFELEKEAALDKTILKSEERPDGRKIDEVREIETIVGLLPRTHGSCLFRRGETRALSILTLGAPGDQQILEGMEFSGKKRFLHHYNFPPYSVGETGPMRGPGRREIGHGMLAEKALLPLLPTFEEFPYTIRIVSEMVSSNGSTSMASVSAACLAMMDGGVPIKRHAAGIAIGLIMDEKGNYKILTDIQGPEDHSGDMDFKVAGTEQGITAIQLDVKIDGLDRKILEEALERGKKARLEIIEIEKKTISGPREKLSDFAPRVYTININPEKIGSIIGPGGKIINEIIEDCGVSIDIEESGQVFITGDKEEGAQKAISWIKNITKEVMVGEIFQGKVRRILGFGAMVEILPGQDGMVHISEFVDQRINKIEEVVKVNDIIPVQVIAIDDQGRINLSAKKAGFKPKTP